MNKIKINTIFESIQGEGKYAGTPMLFIRTSGCTRACDFCDTKYHTEGTYMTIESIIKTIKKSKLDYVCWTGGEPLLWRKQILSVMSKTLKKEHHLETNGDLLKFEDVMLDFYYTAISPKELKTVNAIVKEMREVSRDDYDVKIVTDFKKVGTSMLKYATMLMPLTLYDKKKDLKIQQRVWDYCVKNNIKFTPRYQYWIWDKKRKI